MKRALSFRSASARRQFRISADKCAEKNNPGANGAECHGALDIRGLDDHIANCPCSTWNTVASNRPTSRFADLPRNLRRLRGFPRADAPFHVEPFHEIHRLWSKLLA